MAHNGRPKATRGKGSTAPHASRRQHDWPRANNVRLVGRLTLREFDSLELVDVLGGIVSAHELAERVGVSVDAAYQRLWRLEGVGLLRSWREPNIDNPRAARAYFAPTDDGWALYREAWAAIDAACEEAAA